MSLTLYLTNTLSGGWQTMSPTSPGADAYASPTTGWIVSTGSTNRSKFQAATERAASTFDATTYPTGTLDTTLKDAWDLGLFTGDFASANWTVNGVVRAQSNGGSQDGRLYYRLIRADADGSNAVEITSGQQQGALLTNVSTSADFNSSVTFNPGAFSINNQHLFLQVAWERTGAGAMTTSDINFRIGTNSTRVITSAFTGTRTASLNAVIQNEDTKTASVNAVVAAEFTKTADLNAVIQGEGEKTASLDAVIQAEATLTASLNAVIDTSGATREAATDAVIQNADLRTALLDAVIADLVTKFADANAVIQGTLTREAAMDAVIQALDQQLAGTLNAVISEQATVELTTSGNATIIAPTLVEAGASAVITDTPPSLGPGDANKEGSWRGRGIMAEIHDASWATDAELVGALGDDQGPAVVQGPTSAYQEARRKLRDGIDLTPRSFAMPTVSYFRREGFLNYYLTLLARGVDTDEAYIITCWRFKLPYKLR